MSNLTQFFGSGGGAFGKRTLILYSGDWLVPVGVTKVRAHAWGGGGGGGYTSYIGAAMGGGGGAYTTFDFSVTPNTTIKIVLGAGGLGAINPSATQIANNGTAGGNTSITYGSKIITAGGGQGGTGFISTTPATLSANGGIAANGSININGGNTHHITLTMATNQMYVAFGGAAAATPMYGTPPNTALSISVGGGFVAVGGHGVNGYTVPTSLSTSGPGGGGGTAPERLTPSAISAAGLPSYGLTQTNGTSGGGSNADWVVLSGYDFLQIFGNGGAGLSVNGNGNGGPGGGGGGNNGQYTGGSGGYFGGGGAGCNNGGSTGGKGGLGGGGGGGTNSYGAYLSQYKGGDGGQGIVILEW